jgi:hypothetical protein
MTIVNPLPSALARHQPAAADHFTEERSAPILSPTQRANLRMQWKALIAKHTADKAAWKRLPGEDRNLERPPALPAYAHMLYAVLLGRDWRKGFTQPSTDRERGNGSFTGWQYWRAAYYLRPEMVAAAMNSPEEAAKTAPFHLFVESVPVSVQLAAVRCLPEMPQAQWGYGYTIEKLTAEWPSAPYREELPADASTNQ